MTKQGEKMKARLRRYHIVFYELERLDSELKRMKALDESGIDVQKYGHNAENVKKLRKKVAVSLFRQKKQKQKELDDIDEMLSKLQKSDRDVLICRYILCLSWSETFIEMQKRKHYYSERELLRLHYSAIEHLASMKKRKEFEQMKKGQKTS